MVSAVEHVLSTSSGHMVAGLLRLLRPHTVKGIEKIRVGKAFDGGYIMLDKFTDVRAAYSLGINDDVSWDLQIADRGIEIYQYDHTIERLPAENERFHWQKIGIGRHPNPSANLETLSNMIQANGHENETGLLLKCDIEGFEWDMFDPLPTRVVEQFSQIVVEFHNLADLWKYSLASVVQRVFSKLTTSHKVIHVHGNNYAEFAIVGGFPIPTCLEVTFARHDLGEFSVSEETFPTPMDMPCHPDQADFFLGRFQF